MYTKIKRHHAFSLCMMTSELNALREYLGSDAGLKELTELAKAGKTLNDISIKYGIARMTLYNWSKKNEKIRDALAEGRKSSNERVESSLYEQCFDRRVEEATVEYDAQGNAIKRTVKTRIIPANERAIEYWLSNTSEGKWKARQQLELTGNPGAPVVFVNDIPKEAQVVDGSYIFSKTTDVHDERPL